MSETEDPIDLSDEALDMLVELYEVTERIKDLEARKTKLRDALTTEMVLTDNEAVDLPDGEHQAAVVKPEKTVINEVLLKRKVGVKVWKKITNEKLDKDKLAEAVGRGDVEMATVADCTALIPTAMYVKFTKKKKEQSDATQEA